MNMTHKEFKFWLDGFLVGKKQLVDLEITEIRETMKNLTDEPRVHQIPNYPIPRTIPNPLTPTCSTGKQLLTDSKDNFGDVNG
jgi:hypothetical protein